MLGFDRSLARGASLLLTGSSSRIGGMPAGSPAKIASPNHLQNWF